MVPHDLQIRKLSNHSKFANAPYPQKIRVTYQIGVDILGFPIYVEHEVYRGEQADTSNRLHEIRTYWVRVLEKIIKQH